MLSPPLEKIAVLAVFSPLATSLVASGKTRPDALPVQRKRPGRHATRQVQFRPGVPAQSRQDVPRAAALRGAGPYAHPRREAALSRPGKVLGWRTCVRTVPKLCRSVCRPP